MGCLTPYVTELNSLDEAIRQRELGRLERAIHVAETLESPRIRVYGGTLLGTEPRQTSRASGPDWSTRFAAWDPSPWTMGSCSVSRTTSAR